MISYQEAQDKICKEILDIMRTYNAQMDSKGYVDSPGGLENMGDVWSLFKEWEGELLS